MHKRSAMSLRAHKCGGKLNQRWRDQPRRGGKMGNAIGDLQIKGWLSEGKSRDIGIPINYETVRRYLNVAGVLKRQLMLTLDGRYTCRTSERGRQKKKRKKKREEKTWQNGAFSSTPETPPTASKELPWPPPQERVVGRLWSLGSLITTPANTISLPTPAGAGPKTCSASWRLQRTRKPYYGRAT